MPETNMPVRFYIKPNRADGSASILVAENLDFETTAFFTLRVRVQNVASVPLASFTTVYVNVTGECGGGGRMTPGLRPPDRQAPPPLPLTDSLGFGVVFFPFESDSLAPPFPLRRERQRALLPVFDLRGHGSRRSPHRHLGGPGVCRRPGLGSARGGEDQVLPGSSRLPAVGSPARGVS